jgi:hypothetical protein
MAVRVGNILAVLVDAVIVSILERDDGQDILEALSRTAYGDDPIERVHSINTQILADFVAPRLAKLDEAFVKTLSAVLFLWSGSVAAVIWFFDLDYRVSSLFFRGEVPDGPDDGTSVYRIGLYAIILTFACIFAVVIVAILFLRSFLSSASEIMLDLDADAAAGLLARTQYAMGIAPPTHDRTKDPHQPSAADSAPVIPKGAGDREEAPHDGAPASASASASASDQLPPAWSGGGKDDVHVVLQWADGVRRTAGKSGALTLDYRSLVSNNIMWLVHAEPDDMRVWWRQLSADIEHSDGEMKAQAQLVMTLLGYGFNAVNLFLLIALNLTNDTFRRILIDAACASAILSGVAAGYFTSSMRSYSTVVLGEAARHINAVLNVAQAIEPSQTKGWRGYVRRACSCLTVPPRKSGGIHLPPHLAKSVRGGVL